MKLDEIDWEEVFFAILFGSVALLVMAFTVKLIIEMFSGA